MSEVENEGLSDGLDGSEEKPQSRRKPGDPLVWVPVAQPNFGPGLANPPRTGYEGRRQIIDREKVDEMSGGPKGVSD